MTPAQALTLTAASVLLIAGSRRTDGPIEAAAGDIAGSFSAGAITDRLDTFYNQITEQKATVDTDTATANITAGLTAIAQSEGTDDRGGYRVVYGYCHVIADLSDHPYLTKEWPGVILSDTMCANAGFGPGCKSTAAGRYQITATTWRRLGGAGKYGSFDEAAQDAAGIDLIAGRGALEDLKAGRFADFVHKCRGEWASLPGSTAGQGGHTLTQLAQWFSNAGGVLA